jgi:hypothetical protein
MMQSFQAGQTETPVFERSNSFIKPYDIRKAPDAQDSPTLGESGWPLRACSGRTSAARERALFNRIGPNRQDRHLRKP